MVDGEQATPLNFKEQKNTPGNGEKEGRKPAAKNQPGVTDRQAATSLLCWCKIPAFACCGSFAHLVRSDGQGLGALYDRCSQPEQGKMRGWGRGRARAGRKGR
jgi:hypothetical protein